MSAMTRSSALLPQTSTDPDAHFHNIPWLYSPSSNIHITAHTSWYTSYHPISTSIGSHEVYGIGSISLPVKTHRRHRGKRSHGVLSLENVLYIPDYKCNMVGSLEGIYGVILDGENNMITDIAGCCVAVMDGVRIRLVGQVPGNKIWADECIEIKWEKKEREKWVRYVKDQQELEKRAASLTICDIGK